MIVKRNFHFSFCLGLLLTGSVLNADEDNQDYPPSSGGSWSQASSTKYEHRGALFTGFRYSDNAEATNTYKFTVGRPGDWYFIPSKTGYTGGSKLFDATNTSAGIKKINEADKDPVSFSMLMDGQLTKGGGGTGTVYWDAKAETNFFYLTPFEQLVKAGTDATINAGGDSPLESTWTVDSIQWKDASNDPVKTSSITLGRSLWDALGWTPNPVPTGFDPPTAGSYIISATTTEESSRSADANVYVVEITKPAKDGAPNKWLSTYYDCQAVKSGVDGSYTLAVQGNWATRNDGIWSLSSAFGSIADDDSSSTTYSPPDNTGGVTLRLKFAITGDSVIDSRSIAVYKDHLARNYDNFGTNRSCEYPWKPQTKYGVATNDLPDMLTWNCHGSTLHAYNNSGSGSSSNLDTIITNCTLITTVYQTTKGQSVNLGTLQRGDVIVYHHTYSGSYVLMHSQTVSGGNSTYGANNQKMPEPGAPDDQSWKWYACTAGDWATNVDESQIPIRPIRIRVYRP